MLKLLVAQTLRAFIRLLTGARVLDEAPSGSRQRIYYGNHSSHGDFVLIWSALPPEERQKVRPVAGADYWRKGVLRRYLINQVFNGVLIDRNPQNRLDDPITTMANAIESDASLILFPEGTRHRGTGLLPFKSGIYHLATRCPNLELVPVWLENINRVMPKGRIIPLPLLCTVRFGPPIRLASNEDKQTFLDRSRAALIALSQDTV